MKQATDNYLVHKPFSRSIAIIIAFLLAFVPVFSPQAKGKYIQPKYKTQKTVFEFYFDRPEKIGSALYWLRSFVKPLGEHPYNYSAEFHSIVVVIHGTEIVTLAKKNYKKYKTIVDRMRYYVDLGIKFRICAIAMNDFGYKAKDFHDFVEIVPSAIVELSHWQSKGYSLIIPRVLSKKKSTAEIR